MDKLKLAHEMALAIQRTKLIHDMELVSSMAWKYADAMQAEAEKREDKERPDVLLTKDKDGNCLHFHRDFGRKKCMDCGASLEEWQPDWSQAPEWANSWGMAEIGQAWWLSGEWHVNNRGGFSSTGFIKTEKAPSFDYQGNWKESLRKRPEALCEVDWRVAPAWAKYWAVREDSDTALWCINKPTVTGDCFLSHGGCSPAPSFGFTGSHIVERPHGL